MKNCRNCKHNVFKTNLLWLRKWHWSENLEGFFNFNGRPLTDIEVRKIVEYGIIKGYRCDVDIPDDEVLKILEL